MKKYNNRKWLIVYFGLTMPLCISNFEHTIEYKNVERTPIEPMFEYNVDDMTLTDLELKAMYDCVVENTEDVELDVFPRDVDFVTGWLNDTSNIRLEPSLESEVIEVLPIGTEILYCEADDTWNYIKLDETIAYVNNELVSTSEIKFYTEHYTPYSERMSFMSYKSVTSTTSNQYKLQQIAYTGNFGIRQVNGRYCIAVGTAYTTQIGQYLDLLLENGVVIPCILADCKADIHTDETNRITVHDGSLVEFVVDVSSLESNAKLMGNIHYACDEWNSRVVKIILYDYVEGY